MNVDSYRLQSVEREHGTGEWLYGKCYYLMDDSFMFAEEGDVWLVRGLSQWAAERRTSGYHPDPPERRSWQDE